MSNPNKLIVKALGLNTQPNELAVPDGSLTVAENVEINRDGVVQLSPGFEDLSTNLPDFEVQQLFAFGGVLYAHADDGIWYYDTSNATWVRKTPNSSAGMNEPTGIWIDATETYAYVADTSAHCVWRIAVATGKQDLLAGLPGTSGTTNATGVAARFNSPVGVWGDGTNLYVCDVGNFAIRKIVISTAVVTTFAGLIGTAAYTDHATGTSARFQSLYGIWSDGTYLYATEDSNGRIRKIEIGGTQTVTTLTSGLTMPQGIWVAAGGATLYVVTDSTTAVKSVPISTGIASALASGLSGDSGTIKPLAHSDGTYLWVGSGGVAKINRVTLSGGAVTHTLFTAPATSVLGIWAFASSTRLWFVGTGPSLGVAYPGTGKSYSLISRSFVGSLSPGSPVILSGPS